jgi:polyhydroxyalkanoate synthase
MSFLGFLLLVAVIIAALAVAWSRTLAALYPEKIRTAEVDHITTPDLWKLRMCRYRKANSSGEPVLLVHGLNANQNNFTAPADGCLVDYLSGRGYDCWTLDLRGTRSSESPAGYGRDTVTIEDYVLRDLPAAIDHIRKATGHGKVHYVGHSLGGLLLYAYAQAHGVDKIASGTTLGAPTQFTTVRSMLPEPLVQLVKRLPWLGGEMLRCALPLAKLTGKGISVFPINLDNLPEGMGLGDFYPIIDDPAPLVHAQIFAWADRGEITLREDSLNLSRGFDDMKFPLLAVYAPRDPFVSLVSAEAFFKGIHHADKKMIVCSVENGCAADYGHCDLAFGREGGRDVFEPVMQWMKAHPCPETATARKAVEPEKPKAATAPVAEQPAAAKASAPAAAKAAAKKAAAPKKVAAAKAAPAKTEAAPAKTEAAPAKTEAAPAKAEAAQAKTAVAKKAAVAKKPAVAKAPAAPKPAVAKAAPAKPAAAAKKAAAAGKEKAPAVKAKPAPRKPAAKG